MACAPGQGAFPFASGVRPRDSARSALARLVGALSLAPAPAAPNPHPPSLELLAWAPCTPRPPAARGAHSWPFGREGTRRRPDANMTSGLNPHRSRLLSLKESESELSGNALGRYEFLAYPIEIRFFGGSNSISAGFFERGTRTARRTNPFRARGSWSRAAEQPGGPVRRCRRRPSCARGVRVGPC